MPTDYDFFLRGDHDSFLVQAVEVTHPAFTKNYYFVKNIAKGARLGHGDGIFQDYQYAPIAIQKSKTSDNLDQSIDINVGDLGETFSQEINNVLENENYRAIKPIVNYREYNSKDLTSPMITIHGLEATEFTLKETGAGFKCRAKQLNITSTGNVFTLDEFLALREFV